MRHLLPWLLRAGFSEQLVKERFVEFGQGVASMSPALRDLESRFFWKVGSRTAITPC